MHAQGAILALEQAHVGALAAEGGLAAASSATQQAQDVRVWQPVFASAGGFPRLLFIPVFEMFDM